MDSFPKICCNSREQDIFPCFDIVEGEDRHE